MNTAKTFKHTQIIAMMQDAELNLKRLVLWFTTYYSEYFTIFTQTDFTVEHAEFC